MERFHPIVDFAKLRSLFRSRVYTSALRARVSLCFRGKQILNDARALYVDVSTYYARIVRTRQRDGPRETQDRRVIFNLSRVRDDVLN